MNLDKINKLFLLPLLVGINLFACLYITSTLYTGILRTYYNVIEPKIQHRIISKLPPMHSTVNDYFLSTNGDNFYNLLDSNISLFQIKEKKINILIDSNGGYIQTGLGLINFMNTIKRKGIEINCYVANAGSIAFTILQTCTNRIGLKGGLLFVHRGGGSNYNAVSIHMLNLARIEANKIGIPYKEWYNKSKIYDRTYNMEEGLKLNLIDKILE